MPAESFGSLEDAEIAEVEFATAEGGFRKLRLLVGSGFTGQISFVLGKDEDALIRAMMAPAHASGALHGEQKRAWVTCRIPQIGFQRTLIAILPDLTPLSLPNGVQGMAGLSFLRNFARWGSDRTPNGWRFFVSHNEVNPGL